MHLFADRADQLIGSSLFTEVYQTPVNLITNNYWSDDRKLLTIDLYTFFIGQYRPVD